MESQQSNNQQILTRINDNFSLRSVMGPFGVDQAIRQAISSCWQMLPEQERSVEKVEKEIIRLVQRALQEFKEDTEAFRF